MSIVSKWAGNILLGIGLALEWTAKAVCWVLGLFIAVCLLWALVLTLGALGPLWIIAILLFLLLIKK